ncbi:hypothetical protein AAFF_G00107660 [Aldrovandia affinis]|uniref:Uncharacterized protein n=1 Tax=Aldrovandia affinis TaxID=143900 RepID=A0AAD7WAW8_9TELE|nr:hypothetical protein AAFF_G00107660 [Aldrovandia affinis]
MEDPCAEMPSFRMLRGEKPAECVISGNEMDESDLSPFSGLNYSLEEVSDEEISTKKERHWRLGPEDLNGTLLYDFPESETGQDSTVKDEEESESSEKTH